MPLYKTIEITPASTVFIWKIEETFNDLQNGIKLTEKNQLRLDGMKSDLHQKGFLAVRKLLKTAGYTDEDVIYDEFGKPHLADGKFISITHSFTFCGIIISEEKPVGIDIEKRRDKIVRIAHKFTPIQEYNTIANHDALVSKLTIVWGAKESLYKIYGKKQLHFLDHIYVEDFSFETTVTNAEIRYNSEVSTYKVHFLEFDEFTCVYAM